jgi:undecaprenyl pyrophosphate phosphatase UppP
MTTFARMKLQKYILIEIVMIAVAIGGLLWLTNKDYFLTLGIVILLVVVEHVLVTFIEKKQEEREEAEDETAH